MNSDKVYDCAVIGAGAAGMTAALYCARAGLKTIVLETSSAGGQLQTIDKIENYPSYESITGADLSLAMRNQVMNTDVELAEFSKATKADLVSKVKCIESDEGSVYAHSVIIASGSSVIHLDVENEEKLCGHGIHYCAACDGNFYKGRTVGVVGGGNSAVSAALYLSRIASKVIMIRRKESFNCEDILLDRIKNTENIQILYNWDLTDVLGDEHVIAANIKNTKNSSSTVISLDAVFVFIGYRPQTDIFMGQINTDDDGYIITDGEMCTSIEGVYAAGDVRQKKHRQITTAVSDGTIAALSASRYINVKVKAMKSIEKVD
ncbi:MAG: FAD-dependent oxidoreductase [Oscillospiraceae bacterium]|nr:FAD-dependent oxidoreductase [Oscillospiraceae bacterium]